MLSSSKKPKLQNKLNFLQRVSELKQRIVWRAWTNNIPESAETSHPFGLRSMSFYNYQFLIFWFLFGCFSRQAPGFKSIPGRLPGRSLGPVQNSSTFSLEVIRQGERLKRSRIRCSLSPIIGTLGSSFSRCCPSSTSNPFADIGKNLKPKLQLFQEIGLTGSDLGRFISKNSGLISFSLDRRLTYPKTQTQGCYRDLNEVVASLVPNYLMGIIIGAGIMVRIRQHSNLSKS
ncbi:hypothetical protein NE237_029150 [Protea cynaroides]|uniref:Uncharacterized protein n=1 Tax=Protea cynaroides TaxID=273540 RepID=A0A9Q0GRA9_9MAGN|nr:hypothetical protein NE237_029150 [Protea cynaroides]